MFASQDASVDSKVMTLWQLYSDNVQVATSLRDVESMRTRAQNLGIMTSVAAFGLNEVARLLLRSRKHHHHRWHSQRGVVCPSRLKLPA